jgi:hypothetical protein
MPLSKTAGVIFGASVTVWRKPNTENLATKRWKSLAHVNKQKSLGDAVNHILIYTYNALQPCSYSHEKLCSLVEKSIYQEK